MFEKLKKALKVSKDLDTLEFTFDASHVSHEGLPYTINHPNNLYTIWTANGFWFTALYEVDNKYCQHSSDTNEGSRLWLGAFFFCLKLV